MYKNTEKVKLNKSKTRKVNWRAKIGGGGMNWQTK
jgi:hypothetical protein